MTENERYKQKKRTFPYISANKFTANDKYSFRQKGKKREKKKTRNERKGKRRFFEFEAQQRKKGATFLSRTNYLKLKRYIILDARLNRPNPWNTWLEIAWNAEIG